MEFATYSLLLCTVYMPCDTVYDYSNLDVFNDVLNDISATANSMNIDHIICGGDFNSDLSRVNSLLGGCYLMQKMKI